jgi:predicted secreted hydrolase
VIHRIWSLLAVLLLAALLLAACAGLGRAQSAQPHAQLAAVEAVGGTGTEGFARATAPRDFVFPRDHGPHPEYAIEWWYYTGNLDTAQGRHFGYQLTFFRSALAPEAPERASDWAATQIYMAHFALTDVAGERFSAFDRFSRGAAGLAGAEGEPYRVWLEDWSATGSGPQGMQMHLRAAQGDVAIDLALTTDRPVVLQGDRGLSQKGSAPGNASYYYSLTRMATQGNVSVGGQRYAVHGLSWMDHEFSTSALEQGAVGWDWFAIQLDNGRDLMYARIRNADGSDNYAFGTLVAADGTTRPLAAGDVAVEALGSWHSPRSGAQYPSGWRLRVPAAGLDLRLTPYLADQELPLAVVYWEGAVQVEGTADGQPVRGNAYVELTGYAERQGQGDVR